MLSGMKGKSSRTRSTAVTLLWACVALTSVTAHRRTWVTESGAYHDLAVHIHPALRPSNCTALRTNLEDALTSFSLALWQATHRTLRLGSVRVVVPPRIAALCSFDLGGHRATWEQWGSADIWVNPAPSVHEGWGPLGSVGVGVVQPEGCHASGTRITIDGAMLGQDLPEEIPHLVGLSLTAAWARYRWGVFEERGYDSTLRYSLNPPRKEAASLLASGCVIRGSVEEGNFTCERTQPECRFLGGICPERGSADCDDGDAFSFLSRIDGADVEFCNRSTHDASSPTPQNLICEGRSIWEVIRDHPDFAAAAEASNGDNASPSTPPTPTSITVEPTTHQQLSLQSPENNGGIYDELPPLLTSREEEISIRARRNEQREDVAGKSEAHPSEEASLVRGDAALTPTPISGGSSSVRPPTRQNQPEDSNEVYFLHPSGLTAAETRTEANRRLASPVAFEDEPGSSSSTEIPSTTSTGITFNPDVTWYSSSPQVMIVVLDLSAASLSKVNIEALRGGLMRWLWGLGDRVQLAVIGAYNNASFPFTLGPLVEAPTKASQLKDLLILLPTQEEVEDDVYGGQFCFPCVLQESLWISQQAGVDARSVNVVLSACSAGLTTEDLELAESSRVTLHTIALCHDTPHSVDQLAGDNSAYVVHLVPHVEGLGAADSQVAHVLNGIYEQDVALPTDPLLYKVTESMLEVHLGDVTHTGPYSSVEGTLQLDGSTDNLLVAIVSHQPVKVVTLSDSKNRIEVMRDTNQRFWALIQQEEGVIHYTLKYLSSTLEFPLFIESHAYARRSSSRGTCVHLHTSNKGNRPLKPGNLPVVVWAEVTENGVPVVGAEVVLSIKHLKQNGTSTKTLRMFDDGSTEPDMREGDGIYTRYLVGLLEAGRYSLVAFLTRRYSSPSSLYATEYSSERHYVTSPALSLIVEEVSSRDITPPSRITDLRVSSVTDKYVNLTWTAPGGDLDQGSAWKYELRMYTERRALAEQKFNSTAIPVNCIVDHRRIPVPIPGPYGMSQFCLAEIPFFNNHWHFAIRSVDKANNTGRLSNTVSAWVPQLSTTTTTTRTASSSMQTVTMSTTKDSIPPSVIYENRNQFLHLSWRMYLIIGSVSFFVLVSTGVVFIVCVRRLRAAKDPDRPIYKIYVNNAYIQEEDGEIKVVSNGELMENKDPGQVQDWVNSLGRYGTTDVAETTIPTDTPLVERQKTSIKYSAPVRFGVLTNGSIMRDACGSSTSSSKPSDEATMEDFKYKDMSETNSNTTTEGGTSGSTVPAGETQTSGSAGATQNPSPPAEGTEKMASAPDAKPVPGPTVISIHSTPNNYSSDEEGGFKPRMMPSPGPRRYLPNHFSSFRYLPPPTEYQAEGGKKPIDYPSQHSMSRGVRTLPHGTLRSVKKRRHISFV